MQLRNGRGNVLRVYGNPPSNQSQSQKDSGGHQHGITKNKEVGANPKR